MYLLTRIKDYLDKENVSYQHVVHRTAYTAQEVAAEEHIPGKLMAKAVVVKTDGRYVMAVLPATAKVDLAALQASLGAQEVRLATEFEFTGLFPDCEVGAMPPFGNLYGLPVCVDESLSRDPEIVFNAGTHQDTIRMKYEDFARLARPQILGFSLSRVA
ncbi:MAG: YbaK/EbsC family protein [Acidobacteria bacterium]|nr:YbaK/EbsC family protein [Acidobacteriota bacterium]